jgi:hypothetical protein
VVQVAADADGEHAEQRRRPGAERVVRKADTAARRWESHHLRGADDPECEQQELQGTGDESAGAVWSSRSVPRSARVGSSVAGRPGSNAMTRYVGSTLTRSRRAPYAAATRRSRCSMRLTASPAAVSALPR